MRTLALPQKNYRKNWFTQQTLYIIPGFATITFFYVSDIFRDMLACVTLSVAYPSTEMSCFVNLANGRLEVVGNSTAWFATQQAID